MKYQVAKEEGEKNPTFTLADIYRPGALTCDPKIERIKFTLLPTRIHTDCWDLKAAYKKLSEIPEDRLVTEIFHFEKSNQKGLDGFILLKEAKKNGKFWTLNFEMKFSSNVDGQTVKDKIKKWQEGYRALFEKNKGIVNFPTSIENTLLMFLTKAEKLEGKSLESNTQQVLFLNIDNLYPKFLCQQSQFLWSKREEQENKKEGEETKKEKKEEKRKKLEEDEEESIKKAENKGKESKKPEQENEEKDNEEMSNKEGNISKRAPSSAKKKQEQKEGGKDMKQKEDNNNKEEEGSSENTKQKKQQ
jgi:hypothetical protein